MCMHSACRADSSSSSAHGYVVKMWDVEAGTCLWSVTTHNDMINAIEFSPNGELLVSCSDEGMMIVSESAVGGLRQASDRGQLTGCRADWARAEAI